MDDLRVSPAEAAANHVLAAPDQERLHRLEQRWQTLAEATEQLFWTTDASGQVREDWPTWRRFTGQTVEQVLGGKWLESVHPEDRDSLLATRRQAQTTGTSYKLILRLRRFDGSYHLFLEHGAPVRAADGSISEWVGCYQALSERLQMDAGIAASAAEQERLAETMNLGALAAVFEAMPDSVVFLDQAGQQIRINAAGRALLGSEARPDYAKESLRERLSRLVILDHTGQPAQFGRLPITRILRGEVITGEQAEDMTMIALDGQRRIVSMTGAPVRDAAGRVIGAIAITRDVTERRQLEQDALKSTRQFQALQRLTDTALTHLSMEELLREMLDRLRDVMQVDNAAILLLNQAGDTLVMRAADGPEEEVAAHVRVPLGVGFAGRIASRRAPMVVDDLRNFDAYNPFLRERLRSVVGAPLLVDGRVLGVVHVGNVTLTTFTDADVALLQRAADRIALAVDRADLFASVQAAQAESEARANELEAIFDSLADGVLVFDQAGNIVRMNRAAETLYGYGAAPEFAALSTEERAARQQVRDVEGVPIPPEELPLARMLRGELLQGASACQLCVNALDGRELEVSVTGAPLTGPMGQIRGAVAVHHDVTERRRLERRTGEALTTLLTMAEALVQGLADDEQPVKDEHDLMTQIARLVQQVMEGSYTGIALATPTTGNLHPLAVVGISPEAEARWWERMSQRKDTDLVSADLAERLYAGEVLTLDLAERQPIREEYAFEAEQLLLAAVWVHPEHQCILSVGIRNRPAFTQAEQELAQTAVRLIALVLERDRLLREREEARARALASEETTRRMDEFLSVASHELRTPVTALQMNVQLQLRDAERRDAQAQPEGAPPQDRQLKHLRRTESQIRGLIHLLDDLIDLSPLRAGRLEITLAPVNLSSLVAEIVEEQQLAHPQRQITLEQPAESIAVFADEDRISQVVLNYLTNALKYSTSEQPVAVRLQVDHPTQRAIVAVQDHGPGIPFEEQTRIWELFHRVPGIEVQSGSGIGLGLGLHISKTIIERHQGQIGVESTPGQGSTFWFALPLQSPSASQDQQA